MMNSEQGELKFLGFFGILKESSKIIFSWRKIFSQITLALILPLSFIFLAHIQISQFIFVDILRDQNALQNSTGTPPYSDKLSGTVSSKWVAFWLFKAAYFIVFLILALLSTSAVVYTVACIYTGKEISFKKVMSVVPKVWKRLIVTFLWTFAIVMIYNLVAVFCLLLPVLIIYMGFSNVGVAIFVILFLLYLAGLIYIAVVWQLAGVVSVLEDVYGIQAMKKSKALIKGKMGVALALFLLLILCFGGIQTLFQFEVAFFWSLSVGMRILIGIVCLLLLFNVILFGLVSKTVLYFVCKSHHHENIDKSILADHLEVYVGEYLPLKSKDVQLEQSHV
ncbi:hypothetical protein CCACVL1_25927 [Corchorus capsularis]|uniref:Polyadenylate-binding protein 1-B-binding protein n=1 Tax=Corchorus capsularis TaxID=210143 RepID=A0A1R3GGK2_COCAP|nr:hypothetical protein CCACVL1_25927 [Corchorus capsularis]